MINEVKEMHNIGRGTTKFCEDLTIVNEVILGQSCLFRVNLLRVLYSSDS